MFQLSVVQPVSWLLFVGMLAVSPVHGEASWKLYDLRDLIHTLPPDTTETDESKFEVKSSVDELMARVCGMIQIECALLFTGVYGIRAEQAEHTHMQHLLENIRNLYQERYVVELVMYRIPASESPFIGDSAEKVALILKHQFVVPRRTPMPIQLISQHGYLRTLQPVVATSAQAYGPRTDRLQEGLRLTVLIGAGEEREGRVSIQLSGDLRGVSWNQRREEFSTPSGPIGIELPTEHIRSINASLDIPRDQQTILSVIAGFEDEACYVLAGSVRKQ